MNSNQHIAYRRLKNNGFNVQKNNQIRFNSGSETAKHAVAKTLVGHIALQHGYRVSSEVKVQDVGEIDVLLWGKEARMNYAVECETSPTSETIQSKKSKYVRPPVDDIIIINVTDLPVDYLKAIEYVREELGL